MNKGFQPCLDLRGHPVTQTFGYRILRRAVQLFTGKELNPGPQDSFSFYQSRDRRFLPDKPAFFIQGNFGIWRCRQTCRTCRDFRRNCLVADIPESSCLCAVKACICVKLQPLQGAEEMAFNMDIACFAYLCFQLTSVFQFSHQHGSASVYKSLSQSLMKSVRQFIFYAARGFLPVFIIIHPIGNMGNIRPSARMSNTCCKCINIAVRFLQAFEVLRNPVRR